MSIEKLSEHLAGLRHMPGEEGWNIPQTTAQVLCQTFGVEADNSRHVIEPL